MQSVLLWDWRRRKFWCVRYILWRLSQEFGFLFFDYSIRWLFRCLIDLQRTFRCSLVLFTPSRYYDDTINIVAVVRAAETRPRLTIGVVVRLQAFADINKLFPYGWHPWIHVHWHYASHDEAEAHLMILGTGTLTWRYRIPATPLAPKFTSFYFRS